MIQGAVTNAAGIRSWGGLVADAARQAPFAAHSMAPLPLSEALHVIKQTDEWLVHTIGWEMRDAVPWENNGRCLQRALAAALAVAQRERGSIPGALEAITTADARAAVSAIAYHPTSDALGMWDGSHGVALFRTKTDKLLAIDHTFATAPDGVIEYGDLLRIIGGKAEDVRLVPSNYQPPVGLTGGPGVPALAKRLSPDELLQRFDQLAETASPTARTRDRYGALMRS